MPLKLLALDVDGVLAKPGGPVADKTAALVREIEAHEVRIVLASGKPAYYLAGLARGLGLQSPLIIGENGCLIFDPSKLLEIRLADRTIELNKLENHLKEHFAGRVWVQPNQVQVTLFPLAECKLTEVTIYIKELVVRFELKVAVMPHDDAIDIIPLEINKGRALAQICQHESIRMEDIAAIGDGQNDVPMFLQAAIRIAVGDEVKSASVLKRVHTGEEAIQWVRKYL